MAGDIILADTLRDLGGIRHGFFTSQWGDCGYPKEGQEVGTRGARRDRVASAIGVAADHLLSCYQIHSPDVVTVSTIWEPNDRPKADAMVTNKPGIALGILTADCVPLLFAEPSSGVVGAAHAGWRGALTGVIEHTIEAMEQLGARRAGIRAAIGACIGPQSYEVGPEFPAPFLAEDPDNARFFRPAFRRDRYMFDLPGYTAAKLRRLQLIAIAGSPADTLSDEGRFFSYRRSCLQKVPHQGNLISVIVRSA